MIDKQTGDYYAANAESYGSVAPDPNGNFVAYRNRFSARLEAGARVLDLGCGGGHAALAFVEKGFDVLALDGSPGLAKVAEARLGAPVVVRDFAELDYRAEFDGIWAAASLTHVHRTEFPSVLGRVCAALVPHGLLVASFKCAEVDWRDDHGRFYSAMDAESLERFATAAGFDVEAIDVIAGYGRYGEAATWAWLIATTKS